MTGVTLMGTTYDDNNMGEMRHADIEVGPDGQQRRRLYNMIVAMIMECDLRRNALITINDTVNQLVITINSQASAVTTSAAIASAKADQASLARDQAVAAAASVARGAAGGIATLDSGSRLPAGQLTVHTHPISDLVGMSTTLSGKAETDLSNVSNTDFASKAAAAGVGGGGIGYKDHGVPLAGVTALNVGSGLAVALSAGILTVSIAPLTSARFFRFRATGPSFNTSGGSYFQEIADVQLYTSTDASGTALTVSTAVASSFYGTGFEATKAIDGNGGTYWAAMNGASSSQWIYFDMGSAVSVRSAKFIALVPGGGATHAFMASQLAVEASSDASIWTLVSTVNPADVTGTSGTNVTITIASIQ